MSQTVFDSVDYESLTNKRKKKYNYAKKLLALLEEYQNILVVGVDNVGSKQMQKVRIALRGQAVMLMGKNTLMRLVVNEASKTNPKVGALAEFLRGNVGFVFTNKSPNAIRKIIVANKVPAAAKSGAIAPKDVFVPPGPTGMDPGQTAFFQALNISTKIIRGSIEIVDTVHLIKQGDKVSSSAVALLNKIGIKPFDYGIVVTQVYENGDCYDAAILDLDEDTLKMKFMSAVCKIAALGMSCGYPSTASVPFQMRDAFKKICAIGVECGYEFELLKKFKEGKPAAPAAGEAEKKEEAKKEESESESSSGGGFGMFGGEEGEESEYEEEDEEEDEEE